MMKTYKEINEELHVEKHIEDETIQKMVKRKTPYVYKKAVAVMACMLLVICLSGVALMQNKNDAAQSDMTPFHLEDYVTITDPDHGKTGGMTAMDVAGGLYNMNSRMLNEVVNDVPTLKQLQFPKGYTNYMQYLEYRNDDTNTGPYANISYRAEKDESYYIDALIQDERTPVCYKLYMEDENTRQYKDYKINVLQMKLDDDTYHYWVNAKRKNYDIQITAIVESPKDFEMFMNSFLI